MSNVYEQVDYINKVTRYTVMILWKLRNTNLPCAWDGGIVLPREELKRMFKHRRRALRELGVSDEKNIQNTDR